MNKSLMYNAIIFSAMMADYVWGAKSKPKEIAPDKLPVPPTFPDISQYIQIIIIGLSSIVFLIIAVKTVRKYNTLQKLKQNLEESYSNILVSMKKRQALANKLISITAGYGDHEKLAQITVSAGSSVNARGAGVSNIGRFMALAQSFPELKANETYQTLMQQLETIEDDLQKKREIYNATVNSYNSFRVQFPTVLFAAIFRFKKASYFNVEDHDALEDIKDIQSDDKKTLNSTLASLNYISRDKAQAISEMPKEEALALAMFCAKCNSPLELDSKFCGSCGNPTTQYIS